MTNNNFCDFFDRQPEEVYEGSHAARLDFLVEDLELEQLSNCKIGDFGCGYGCTLKRMPTDRGNNYFGWDGYENTMASKYCDYRVVNFDHEFADEFLASNDELDVGFCFETIEHVQNPYNMLYEIKKILKTDGILHLTIPHAATTHNTIYPSLMDKNFVQVVYELKNKTWEHCQMVWHKPEDKFRNIPPHMAINV